MRARLLLQLRHFAEHSGELGARREEHVAPARSRVRGAAQRARRVLAVPLGEHNRRWLAHVVAEARLLGKGHRIVEGVGARIRHVAVQLQRCRQQAGAVLAALAVNDKDAALRVARVELAREAFCSGKEEEEVEEEEEEKEEVKRQ